MKNISNINFRSGVTIALLILIPLVSSAQSVAEDSAFTRKALFIGFVVLSVFALVFLVLMLKARVNELQTFSEKDIHRKRKATPWKGLMSLNEDEVNALLEKRTKLKQESGSTAHSNQK